MSMIEENGQKLAAVLCVASCFPVVATVYAMETDPGWHGDKYINEDATVVKGWQEIDSKAYYFSEDGQVDKKTTEDAVVAKVNVDITGDVQDVVKGLDVVEEVAEEVNNEEAVVDETVVDETVVETPVETPAEVPVETPVEVPVEAPVEIPVETPVEAPVVETPAPEYVEETVVEVEVPAEEVAPDFYYEETYTEPEYVAPEYTEPEYVEPVVDYSNPYAQLNANISYAAQQLVGVTNGQWCTEVVQQALANAGVYDAYQLWPDQYADQYGYYTSDPQAGNLIYYYNGGRGVDHIAVYIGEGMAVHGNYNGETVVASVYIPGGAPQYIQVCR